MRYNVRDLPPSQFFPKSFPSNNLWLSFKKSYFPDVVSELTVLMERVMISSGGAEIMKHFNPDSLPQLSPIDSRMSLRPFDMVQQLTLPPHAPRPTPHALDGDWCFWKHAPCRFCHETFVFYLLVHPMSDTMVFRCDGCGRDWSV